MTKEIKTTVPTEEKQISLVTNNIMFFFLFFFFFFLLINSSLYSVFHESYNMRIVIKVYTG